MQHEKITEIQAEDRTLVSEDYETWKVVALESGMEQDELHAVNTVRLRLLGAAAVTSDVFGANPPADAVTEVLRQIHQVAIFAAGLNFYW